MVRTNNNRGDLSPSAVPLAQLLGLHPIVAVMVIAVDFMLIALDLTVVMWPVSCLVAGVLIWPCYTMQKNSYGDTHEVALAKAIFVAVLTAIPTPLPSFLIGGVGVIGMAAMRLGRGKDAKAG